MKVVHIITELNVGGAEQTLYKLMLYGNRTAFDYVVISLEDEGVFGEAIAALGVPVHTLNLNPARPNPLALLKLIRILRREKPDLIQTWLYHADLAGTLASFFVPHHTLAWNIRNATMSNFRSGIQGAIFRALATLSKRPDFIITNTEQGHRQHVQEGYRDGHWHVIYNGFDLDVFKHDMDTRSRSRTKLNIPTNAFIIGQIGRLTPEKNYQGFIHAALKLLETHPEVHFVGIGKDVMFDTLGDLIPLELSDQFHLLGLRHDMADLYNVLDVFTLASHFEGLPNVVGEAMATGIPCVVTDVGDTAYLVGDTGIVVPPQDINRLAAAWTQMINMPATERAALGQAALNRIREHFSIQRFVEQYESLYQNAVKQADK
jgi:glycosyltransferase involved in cell wall biosynthesis